jgi:hypothetical protein
MRIRVTMRADLFEERKQQHIERGYRIEEERPIPVNGFCSFIAVSEIPDFRWNRGPSDTGAQGANNSWQIEEASVRLASLRSSTRVPSH